MGLVTTPAEDCWPVICRRVDVGMTRRWGSPPGKDEGIRTVVVDAGDLCMRSLNY